MSIKTYLFHELSSIFPLIEGEEFNDLVQDIKEHGLLEPIVLYEEKILDGRNRYRVCVKIKLVPTFRDLPPNITPLDFIISENLKRRHLTTAQRSEIGKLLLEVEKKKAEERMQKIRSEIGKAREGSRAGGEFSKSKISDLEKNIEQIKSELGEGRARDIAAKKVGISGSTLEHAVEVMKVAKTDKTIAEDWEKAKKGDIGVDAVYKKVQDKELIETLTDDVKEKVIKGKLSGKETRKLVKTMKEIEKTAPELREVIMKPETKITEEKLEEIKEVAKLPEDVRKEVVKEELTAKEAKEVTESFKEPEMRKEAIKTIKKEKKEHERTMDYITKVGTGEARMPRKYVDVDKKKVNQFQDISKQIVINMTMRNVKSCSEQIQPILIKIMKRCLEHLQKELNIKGEIISV